MNRLRRIVGKFGWKTPFVVLSVAVDQSAQLRSALLVMWLRLTTQGRKGRGIFLGQNVKILPGCHIVLEDQLYVGDRCVLEVNVSASARLSIGARTWISRDCHLSSGGSVSIGTQVLIGEFVSIRDTSHSFALSAVPIAQQSDIVGFVVIEDEVWIGRGCLVLGRPEGVVIGRGAVIAANSVVSRSIPPMQVWGGVPARFIKNRSTG